MDHVKNNGADPKSRTLSLGEALEGLIRRTVIEAVQATQAKEPEFLTPDELAKKLKVSKAWIYEQSNLGHLPTHRFGRHIRFVLSEVLTALDQK